METKHETAYFAGGCFWCVEAVFQRLIGVETLYPGYMGGIINNPTYREVCTGRTGHAEVIKLVFDPDVISYQTLLSVFFSTHDPTMLNRQGNDVGTQYRSAIFYTSIEQKEIATKLIVELGKTTFENPIVTELNPERPFYKAEEEHKNYYNTHKEQSYCSYVINPKVKKLKSEYRHLLKEN